jgi:hypothetical protein
MMMSRWPKRWMRKLFRKKRGDWQGLLLDGRVKTYVFFRVPVECLWRLLASHLLRGWKDRIGKRREWRSCVVVRFKYPESSKSQQMIDVPLSLKFVFSLLFMQFY